MTAGKASTVSRLVLGLVVVLIIGAFVVSRNAGWLSPFGIGSKSTDSQIVNAIERTQEVSLLSLHVQGIREEDRKAKVLGKSVPGTGKKVFLQYNFQAKLGIDGAKVRVARVGENAFRVTVPEFIFIGYDEPTFKIAAEDGGVLGWVVPDIDKVEMVNEVLGEKQRLAYIASNEELLKEQTKSFYNGLIRSIDPNLESRFEFQNSDD